MKKPTSKPAKQKPNMEAEFFKKMGIPPFKKPVHDDGVNNNPKKK